MSRMKDDKLMVVKVLDEVNLVMDGNVNFWFPRVVIANDWR
jgi:hypothetical protein